MPQRARRRRRRVALRRDGGRAARRLPQSLGLVSPRVVSASLLWPCTVADAGFRGCPRLCRCGLGCDELVGADSAEHRRGGPLATLFVSDDGMHAVACRTSGIAPIWLPRFVLNPRRGCAGLRMQWRSRGYRMRFGCCGATARKTSARSPQHSELRRDAEEPGHHIL